MVRKTYESQEIKSFFHQIGLHTDADRQKILSQGLPYLKEEKDELTCIILDHSTKNIDKGGCYAKLESDP